MPFSFLSVIKTRKSVYPTVFNDRHWHQNLCCLYYHIHTLTEIKEIILPSKNIKNNTNLACDQGKDPFF